MKSLLYFGNQRLDDQFWSQTLSQTDQRQI